MGSGSSERIDGRDGFFASIASCCGSGLRYPADFKDEQQFSENRESVLIFDEPRPIEAEDNFNYSSQRPLTAVSMPRSIMSTKRRPVSRARTSIFSARPWTSYSTAKARPRISAPMDFRRVSDPINVERRGRFRPLELSIYLPSGRLSPLPDFDTFDWEFGTANLEMPKPAVVRDSIIEPQDVEISSEPQNAANFRDSMDLNVEDGPGPILQQEDYSPALPGLSFEEMNRPSYSKEDYLITLPKQPNFSAPRPHTSRSPSGTRTPEPSRGHGRSLSDLVRPLRSSSGSIKRSKPNDPVDDAIRELNTIVEERRVTALRNSQPESTEITNHHVPAIAPSMKVRVRSETLSDIGSAFSMPLSNNSGKPGEAAVPTPPGSFYAPLTSPPAATVKSSRSSRLRTWFTWSTGSDSSTDSIRSPMSQQEPFYQCAPVTTDQAYPYGHVASPSASSISTEVVSLTESVGSPITAFTGATTPVSFSPTDEHPRVHTSPKAGFSNTAATSRPRSSISSASRNIVGGGRRLPPLPRKRDVSVDTTSTVTSSILDMAIAAPPAQAPITAGAYVDVSAKPMSTVVTYRDINPLHQHPVGVAY